MKKLVLVALVAAAMAAVLTPAGSAVDTQGPPCGNITSGGGTYSSAYQLHFEYTLDSAACSQVTYSLRVYSFDANSGTATYLTTASPSGSCTTLTGPCESFDADLTQSGSPQFICVVGVTQIHGHVIDVAPDNYACNAVNIFEAGGGTGGTSAFG